MRNIWFIAIGDIRHQLRQGATLMWLFLMPPIFMFFIGNATGGMGGPRTEKPDPLVVVAASPGEFKDRIGRRLEDNNFTLQWLDAPPAAATDETLLPARVLTLPDRFSERLGHETDLKALYQTDASVLARDYEKFRVQRALYTVLADLAVAGVDESGVVSAAGLASLDAAPRTLTLDVAPAGKRLEVPSGFDQAIPGIMVMFTLLVLLTSGSAMLVIERRQGLLRRLASAPISRHEVVLGKWVGRMALAILQIAVAMAVGTLLFDMHWGPDLAMVLVVLIAWAGFCASAGLLLGSLARTEGQATGYGVLTANALAALGGCWWPIEVTPKWTQALQNFLPTGWTMDALHKLVSFQSGAVSALPQVLVLCAAAGIVGLVAVSRFRYQA